MPTREPRIAGGEISAMYYFLPPSVLVHDGGEREMGRGTNKRNDNGDASGAETGDESSDVHHI
jgi:hypothetical protein